MPRKFLVVVDDSPEFETALRYAARRARSTGGRVALLRVIGHGSDAHWSGVRDEIDRQLREEAEALLMRLGEEAADRSGRPSPESRRPRGNPGDRKRPLARRRGSPRPAMAPR